MNPRGHGRAAFAHPTARCINSLDSDDSIYAGYPFLDLPNVLGSPHNSPRTPGGGQVSAARACENIARWLRGETPHGLLDAASVNMA